MHRYCRAEEEEEDCTAAHITKLTETVPFIIVLFHSIKMLLLSARVEIFYGTETEAKSLENVQKCFCRHYILPRVGTVC